jgi:hypothetical protein
MSFQAQQERRKAEPRTNRERFMEHYNLTDEQMNQILEWIGEDVYKLLPKRGEGLAQTRHSSQVSICYAPKKSMLEDTEAFRAYQEAWFKSQGKRAVLVT